MPPVKNNGKEAERSFIDYWTTLGHCHRLRDRADLVALNNDKTLKDFKKPSDFLVSAPGVPLHYAEVKSTHHKTLFEFKCIQDGQSTAAQLEARRGSGSYWFYIFSYHLGRWFIMPCHQYVAVLASGRKSIKFEELSPWTK